MLDIDQIANIINAAAVQIEDADVRAGMYRWISQFRAGGEEINERIEVSAARALHPENYGKPYAGNIKGVRIASEIARALVIA